MTRLSLFLAYLMRVWCELSVLWWIHLLYSILVSFCVIELKLFVFLDFLCSSALIQFFIDIIVSECSNVKLLNLIIVFEFITSYDYIELLLHLAVTILCKMIQFVTFIACSCFFFIVALFSSTGIFFVWFLIQLNLVSSMQIHSDSDSCIFSFKPVAAFINITHWFN